MHGQASPALLGFAEAMLVPAVSAIRSAGGSGGRGDARRAAGVRRARAAHECRRGRTAAAAQDEILIIGAGTLGLLFARRGVGGRGAAGVGGRAARAPARGGGPARRPSRDRSAGTRGRRAGIVVIAAGGGDQLLADALAAVDVGGEVIVLGLLEQPQTIDARRAVLRGVRAGFSVKYGDGDMARALAILAGDPERFMALVSRRFELGEVAAAFASFAADHAAPTFRVLVAPAAERRGGSRAARRPADEPDSR